MNFSKDETIEFVDGTTCRVISYLGGGGQGKAYKVFYNDFEYALKMYHPRICSLETGKAFKNNLQNNIQMGSLSNNIVWPLKMTKTYPDGSFGYLMRLIPSDFESFSKFITKIKTGKAPYDYYFAGAITVTCRIVFEFQKLWRKGLCFQDLNEGSIFINPMTWEVLICDCDNVAKDKTKVFVKGMPGYMAPEIYTGQDKPNYHSDLHSLGVIIFMLLFGGTHPLYGKEARRLSFDDPKGCALKTYGTEAIYVMDKGNDINRPQQGIDNLFLTLYPFYPNYVKELFEEMFTSGIKNPLKRPDEKKILSMLGELHNDLIFCPNCDKLLFASFNDEEIECLNCHHKVNRITYVKNEFNSIAVEEFKRLYKWQLSESYPLEDDAFEIVGVFEKNENGDYKIINNTNENWILKLNDQQRDVGPGKSIIIKNKAIKFYIKESEFSIVVR